MPYMFAVLVGCSCAPWAGYPWIFCVFGLSLPLRVDPVQTDARCLPSTVAHCPHKVQRLMRNAPTAG
eukprot:462408-Pyramimonas_sp.AAC.1